MNNYHGYCTSEALAGEVLAGENIGVLMANRYSFLPQLYEIFIISIYL